MVLECVLWRSEMCTLQLWTPPAKIIIKTKFLFTLSLPHILPRSESITPPSHSAMHSMITMETLLPDSHVIPTQQPPPNWQYRPNSNSWTLSGSIISIIIIIVDHPQCHMQCPSTPCLLLLLLLSVLFTRCCSGTPHCHSSWDRGRLKPKLPYLCWIWAEMMSPSSLSGDC